MVSSLAWLSKAATLTIVLLQIWFVSKGLADDKIVALPGQPAVEFNQYAGYVEVDKIQNKSLFYYFVEAETNPQTKPLVLWLNGGPGCSSLSGAFEGHGPFLPKGQILLKNNYSWTQEANMLFLESPAGVGFSFSSNKSFTNDEITARDNLKFLFGWLDKYPQYKNRDFFITGVSYAGHYVPQLATLLLQSTLNLRLKGISIGNPLLDHDTDKNAMGEFLWSHGLISDSTYSMTKSVCNVSQIFRQLMQGNLSSACSQVYEQGIGEIGDFVEISDVLLDVCYTPETPSAKATDPTVRQGTIDVCLPIETIKYLNMKDVQEALHAKLVGVTKWVPCASVFGYVKEDSLVSTLPLIAKLVKGGTRVMIYSGDQDVIIPFIGTRSLIRAVAENLGLNTTVPYTSWLQNKQVGGWVQVYGDVLTYATVRGGGHDSSFSQPERTLALFNAFLQGKSLTIPPLAKP